MHIEVHVIIIEVRGWGCPACRIENYAFRTACFRCGRARSCQRSEPVSNMMISTIEETTAAEGYLEAVDMETGVEVVTLRVMPPINRREVVNRKTSKDNGGGDPTIVRG